MNKSLEDEKPDVDPIAVAPDRWKKIQEAFQAVVDCSPGERSSRLDKICAGDAELRRQVAELIEADERASGFLETGSAAGGLPPAQKVGPYRVLHRLGEGGMSEVYAAVREDDAYAKRVAVKFFRAGLARPDLMQRFRVERQILASLDHPHIAKLLDGGSTAGGTPYLVMDYVEGLPIDEYCDRQRLPVAARLALFRKVCDAVQYAHANLVVHRDLKPSNILVRSDGEPKLLDFGIAKLLNPDLTPFPLEPTRADAYVMTPEYASPEQARGEPVNTAADIYSLGVLLYKLLTGSLPYDVRDRALPEIVRVVCEEEPTRPGALVLSGDARLAEARASTVRGLSRQLAGDLDNIVLKALRKEPSRRYGSVEQFSEDVRRHREGMPVLARSDTLAYRASKFLRRHRVSVATAGLAAVLVIAFAVTATIQSARLRHTLVRSRAVTRFLQETLGSANPYGGMGRETTVVEMLERTEQKSGTTFADDLEVDATVHATIGLTYRDLGRYDRARPLLEKALEKRRRLYGPSHPTVADTLLDLAGLLDQKGDLAAAEGLYREALAIDRAAFGADSVEASRALSGLGTLFQKKGDHTQAGALLREALSARRRRLSPSDARVARSLRLLGSLLHDKGDYGAAESHLQEALDILKRTSPQSAEMTLALREHAALLVDKGEIAAAEPMFREVLARQRALLGEEHTAVAESRANLARVLAQKGDLEEATRQQREALAVFRRVLGEESASAAAAWMNLGIMLMQSGDLRAAEEPLEKALSLSRAAWGHEHVRTAAALENLAYLRMREGRYAAAERHFREGWTLKRSLLGEAHPETVNALNSLAYTVWKKGNREAAVVLFTQAVDLYGRVQSTNRFYRAVCQSDFGALLTELGRYEEAREQLTAAHRTLQESLGRKHEQTKEAAARLTSLGRAWRNPAFQAEVAELLAESNQR